MIQYSIYDYDTSLSGYNLGPRSQLASVGTDLSIFWPSSWIKVAIAVAVGNHDLELLLTESFKLVLRKTNMLHDEIMSHARGVYAI